MNSIASIEAVAADGGSRTWVLVVVETSDGVVGVGEATLELHTDAVLAAVAELAELIAGMPAARIQDIWHSVQRRRFWPSGAVTLSALSGIEQALWDIKGKVAGLPVYELLGGACRDRLLLYANYPDGLTPGEMAADLRASGLTAIKITPFPTPVPLIDAREGAVTRAVEETAALRDAVGPAVRIAIDVHGRLSPAMSVLFAREVEPLDIWFLEEPALPDDFAGLAKVARSTTIPVASGERLFTRADFQRLITESGVALVQPDLAHCGGVLEGRFVAAIAEAAHVGFAPHNPMSAVNTAASAHVGMTSPNFVALEHKRHDSPWQAEALATSAQVHDGYLHLGAEPGLGIRLDLAELRKHPPLPRRPADVRRADGSSTDW